MFMLVVYSCAYMRVWICMYKMLIMQDFPKRRLQCERYRRASSDQCLSPTPASRAEENRRQHVWPPSIPSRRMYFVECIG